MDPTMTVTQNLWLSFMFQRLKDVVDDVLDFEVRIDGDDDENPTLAKYMYEELLDSECLDVYRIADILDSRSDADLNYFNDAFMYMEEGEYAEGVEFSIGCLFEAILKRDPKMLEHWENYVNEQETIFGLEHRLIFCKFELGEIKTYRKFMDFDTVCKPHHRELLKTKADIKHKIDVEQTRVCEEERIASNIRFDKIKILEIQRNERVNELQQTKYNSEKKAEIHLEALMNEMIQEKDNLTVQVNGFAELETIDLESLIKPNILRVGNIIIQAMITHKQCSKILYNGSVMLLDIVKYLEPNMLMLIISFLKDSFKK